MTLQLYIATRKGFWIASTEDRAAWALRGPTFLGQQCHHIVLDPRDQRTLLCASRQWHLGPTVFRSPLTQWMFEDSDRSRDVRQDATEHA